MLSPSRRGVLLPVAQGDENKGVDFISGLFFTQFHLSSSVWRSCWRCFGRNIQSDSGAGQRGQVLMLHLRRRPSHSFCGLEQGPRLEREEKWPLLSVGRWGVQHVMCGRGWAWESSGLFHPALDIRRMGNLPPRPSACHRCEILDNFYSTIKIWFS